MQHPEIPVIDIAGLSGSAPDAAQAGVAGLIGAACRGPGFFYITGHGIPPDLTAGLFAQAQAFFAQDSAAKMRLAYSAATGNRGYVPMKGEALDPTRPADLKEAFNIGLDLAADDPEILAGARFRAANLWPELPGFHATMLAYFDAAWAVGRLLHRAFARDLGQQPGFFEDKLDRPLATLRLLHYPPQPAQAPAGQLGAGEHTDYGCVTLLLTDEVGGLEVRRRDGTWIAAPHLPGAIICNIGDCLMRWTNDIYISTPHRVVNPAGRERFSVAFFLDPNPDAVVACLPGCDGPAPDGSANPARYPPIRADDYLLSRLTATYAGGGLLK